MAGAKEIRTKIKSIQNTRKITSAMQMVAASKMRRAQERMSAARPYGEKMRNVVSHLAHAHPEYSHGYMQEREVKRVGYIIVSTDRGLCGGLNINLFRKTVRHMKEVDPSGGNIDLCTIGSKASGFFKRMGGRIVGEASHLGDTPHVEELISTVRVMLDEYLNGEIDKLYLVYNEFVNTMTQKPRIEQLLPVHTPQVSEEMSHHWDYIYEPDSKEVVDHLMTRFIESLVYQAVVENAACEQAARMMAMQSATDNAGKLIDELQLAYNKARQAAITQEISEIVSGAAAIS
jgi:F-type H+-transporting ATPase subunit gamma